MIDSGAEIDEKTELDFYLKYMFAVEQGYLEERIHYPFDNTQVGKGKKKRSKAFNLLKRLSRYADVLTFFLEQMPERLLKGIFKRAPIFSSREEGAKPARCFPLPPDDIARLCCTFRAPRR